MWFGVLVLSLALNCVLGDGSPWWSNAVYYRILVDSFKDGDGDGLGDLSGEEEFHLLVSKCRYYDKTQDNLVVFLIPYEKHLVGFAIFSTNAKRRVCLLQTDKIK